MGRRLRDIRPRDTIVIDDQTFVVATISGGTIQGPSQYAGAEEGLVTIDEDYTIRVRRRISVPADAVR